MQQLRFIALIMIFLVTPGALAQTSPPATATPPAETAAPLPLKKSARWYYERALVLFTQEKTARAIVELYRAEEGQRVAYEVLEAKYAAKKDSTPAETAEHDSIKEQLKEQDRQIALLLGMLHRRNQRTVDAIQTLEKIVDPPNPEHIPARLELARAYAELRGWDQAYRHTAKLVKLLNVRDGRTNNAFKQIQTWLVRSKEPAAEKNLTEGFKIVLSGIETVLFDSPVKYREWTLGQKVRDPFVYGEVIRLFQEDDNPAETQAMLTEALRVRDGFAPIILLGLGEFEETTAGTAEKDKKPEVARTAYQTALNSYETAATQLKALDFTEGKDFSTDRITQLRKKLQILAEPRP